MRLVNTIIRLSGRLVDLYGKVLALVCLDSDYIWYLCSDISSGRLMSINGYNIYIVRVISIYGLYEYQPTYKYSETESEYSHVFNRSILIQVVKGIFISYYLYCKTSLGIGNIILILQYVVFFNL